MSYYEIFPQELRHKDKINEAVEFVRQQTPVYSMRALMIRAWCLELGVDYTKELVDYVTG